MVWNIEPPPAKLGAARRAGRAGAEFPDGPPPGHTSEYLPNTSDWLGRWRYVQNPANDYLIDRAPGQWRGRDCQCELAESDRDRQSKRAGTLRLPAAHIHALPKATTLETLEALLPWNVKLATTVESRRAS